MRTCPRSRHRRWRYQERPDRSQSGTLRSPTLSQPLQRTVLPADPIDDPPHHRKAAVNARAFDLLSAVPAAEALGRARGRRKVQGDLMAYGPLELFEVHRAPFDGIKTSRRRRSLVRRWPW